MSACYGKTVKVRQEDENRGMRRVAYSRPDFRGGAAPPRDGPLISDIALDWDFFGECFQQFEFVDIDSFVERYISDVCGECERLGKNPLDECAKARSGLMLADLLLCSRSFASSPSWSKFS